MPAGRASEAAAGLCSIPVQQRSARREGRLSLETAPSSSPMSWQRASGVLSKCLGNLPVGSHSRLGGPWDCRVLGGSQRLIGEGSKIQHFLSWKKRRRYYFGNSPS